MFDKAMKMFLPFGPANEAAKAAGETTGQEDPSDIDELKKQLAQMQKQLDALTSDKD